MHNSIAVYFVKALCETPDKLLDLVLSKIGHSLIYFIVKLAVLKELQNDINWILRLVNTLKF